MNNKSQAKALPINSLQTNTFDVQHFTSQGVIGQHFTVLGIVVFEGFSSRSLRVYSVTCYLDDSKEHVLSCGVLPAE